MTVDKIPEYFLRIQFGKGNIWDIIFTMHTTPMEIESGFTLFLGLSVRTT